MATCRGSNGWLLGTAIGGNLAKTATNGYVYVTSPLYDFAQIKSPTSMTIQIAADAFVNLEAASQAMRIEYSLNAGGTWATLLDLTNVVSSGWSVLNVGQVSLSPASQSLQVRFGYKVITVSGQATTSGISLDNVRLTCSNCGCAPQ